MNIAIEPLRVAHQKIEAVLEMLAREGADQMYPEAYTFLETAEKQLWSQLQDTACEEVVKTIPVETLEKLGGFDQKTLHSTIRRATLRGF